MHFQEQSEDPHIGNESGRSGGHRNPLACLLLLEGAQGCTRNRDAVFALAASSR